MLQGDVLYPVQKWRGVGYPSGSDTAPCHEDGERSQYATKAELLRLAVFPVDHPKGACTINIPERAFAESRHRIKVIPRFLEERASLTRRGRPGRSLLSRPSKGRATKRARHRPTVCSVAAAPGDGLVGLAWGAGQDDACAMRQRLGRLRATTPLVELVPFLRGHDHGGFRASCPHEHSPFYMGGLEENGTHTLCREL